MRWQSKDERIIKRFLIFPKEINNEIRWFKFATIKQLYGYKGWFDWCWVNKKITQNVGLEPIKEGVDNMEKSIEFIGSPTGDGECFCWEVDEENYIKITGEIPDDMDYVGGNYSRKEGIFKGGKLMIYPSHIFSTTYIEDEIKYRKKTLGKCKITISFEELD